MKLYKWNELIAICKRQGYKLAKLQNSEGDNLTSYNKINTPISKQFGVMQTRLQNEILPDGIYWVCLATKINNSGSPDKFPISKGRVNSNMPTVQKNGNVLNEREYFVLDNGTKNNLLTQESALKMLTEISDLKARVRELEIENNYLQLQIEELESGEGLKEGEENSPMLHAVNILKDQAPAIIGGLSEYFKLENRKVDLKEKELELKLKTPTKNKLSGFQEIKPGTDAHVNLIKMYAQKGNEKKFNSEMEKLKAVNQKLYDQLAAEFTEEEES